MTDYVVSARITGDSSELVKASAEGVAAVNSFGDAAKGAAAGPTALAAAINQVIAASHPATGSTTALKAAIASAKQQFDAGSLSGDAYARVLQVAARNGAEFERLQRLVNKSVDDGAHSFGNARIAQLEMMHVVTATGDALNAGIPLSRVFAMETGRVGEAAVLMGGSLGAVGKFLSGPWGIAVMLGVSVLGSLIGSLLSSGDESKKAAAATDIHKMSIDQLVKAINAQDQALRKSLETGQLAEEQSLRAAVALRNEAQARLNNAKGMLAEAEQRLQAQNEQSQGPGQRGELGTLGLPEAQNAVYGLRAEIDQLQAALDQSNKDIRDKSIPLYQRFVKEGLDPMTKATDDHERSLQRLRLEYEHGDITGQQYADDLKKIEQAFVAQKKAIEDATRASKEHANQIGRVMTLAQGEALIKSIGGTVTSGQRSFATQQRLYQKYLAGTGPLAAKPGTSYHEVGQALDIAKTTGMTLAKIRDAFRDAGVPVKELLDEGDHFHVAWGKAADTAKVAAQAINQLNEELSQIITKFDPMLAASNDFLHTLQQIRQLAPADNFFNPGGKGAISATQAGQYEFNAANAYSQQIAQIQDEQRASVNDFFKQNADVLQREVLDPLAKNMVPVIVKAGRDGGHAFGDEAARAIGDLVGGKLGNVLGGVMSVLSGSTAGLRQAGPLGDILSLLSAKPREGQQVPQFTQGLQAFVDPIKHGLKDVEKKIAETFHIGGDFEKTLGHMAGGAALGSLIGPGIVNLFGGKGSSAGGAIGGALGEAAGKAFLTPLLNSISGSLGGFAGPIGAVAGSILGSVIGGLFKPAPKTGGAIVTSTTGASQTVGNDATSISAASGSASSIQQAIAQIAQQLGGSAGSFKISIGEADGKWSVDPLGLGRSAKPGGGATGFGGDEQAAVQFAIQQAIAQGAVKGLDAAVQKALASSTDLQQSLKEAVDVQGVEDLQGHGQRHQQDLPRF
ncbi:MAG TPA: D-alanyl-D-alanine carboxypeptidase family protein [Allosphingosinicella sp.]|jgi:uncharacterized protein YcbK (DUF882 family)|nr:D-alanyl-D-alanine carboxypeptidase family protein [Allosphingosinicella sp.]